MKTFIKYFAIIVSIFLISGAAIYFLFPSLLFNAAVKMRARRSGIVEKTITAGKHTWSFYEAGGNNKDVLLLIHGYGAGKFRWVNTIAYFKHQFHVIAPDLPGFGKTKIDEHSNYDIKSFVRYLDDFVQAEHLKKFNLVGTSLGGYVAGYYATVYPGKVESLILIDTAGVMSPIVTDYQKHYAKTGENLLDYKTAEGFDTSMALVFFKPPAFPSFIKRYFGEEKKKNLPVEKKIFNAIIKNGVNQLGNRLGQIKARTLVIWGGKDRIIDVSTARVIKEKLKNSEIHILKDVGHVPNLEAPEETHKIMRNFLNSGR
jgi:abhydrolase domain-containing protein 6